MHPEMRPLKDRRVHCGFAELVVRVFTEMVGPVTGVCAAKW